MKNVAPWRHQGAQALSLSVRQFQRVKVRYRRDGPRGLLHRGRGRPSHRRLPAAVRQQIAALLQTRYRDVNDCHLTEKLREVEGLRVSRASVRRLRRALGLPPQRRRRPRQYRAAGCPPPSGAPSSSSTAAPTPGSKAAAPR